MMFLRIFIISVVGFTPIFTQDDDDDFFPEPKPVKIAADTGKMDFHAIKALTVEKQRAAEKFSGSLDLWKFEGFQADVYRIFLSVQLQCNLTEGFEIYQKRNLTELVEEFESNNRLFGLFRRLVVWRSLQIAPFSSTFVGFQTSQAYEISIRVQPVDFARVGAALAGILLFVCARRLSRNALFYYGSGCSVGLLASVLILVFVLYRLLPRKSLAYSVLVGGWTFSAYLFYYLWKNLYSVVQRYQTLVGAYFLTVLLISFGVCYRYGPIKNRRSLNLSQWALQLVALCLLYGAVQIREAGISVVVAILFAYNIPECFWRWLAAIPSRLGRPQVVLLSKREFEEEGKVETEKALQRLREYCRSPDCDAWNTLSRLHSPQQFSSFIGGASHLEDEEDQGNDLNDDEATRRRLSDDLAAFDEESDDDVDLADYLPQPLSSKSPSRRADRRRSTAAGGGIRATHDSSTTLSHAKKVPAR